MNRLNVKKLGLAFGLTGTLLYFGCMIIMIIIGPKGTIWFFNSLLHGLDTTSIIMTDMSLLDAFLSHAALEAGENQADQWEDCLKQIKSDKKAFVELLKKSNAGK